MDPNILLGEWHHPEACIIFSNDGTFAAIFGNVPIVGAWQVIGDRLILQSQAVSQFVLSWLDGTLWLDNMPFQRSEENPAPQPKAKPKASPKKSKKAEVAKWVPPKLCGTWDCLKSGPVYGGSYQISRVLVLNQDGTFQYTTDNYNSGAFGQVSGASRENGRWWLEGSQLWFNSDQGQYSRQMDLQNHPKTGDPMIVLNGDNYVTKFRRPPW